MGLLLLLWVVDRRHAAAVVVPYVAQHRAAVTGYIGRLLAAAMGGAMLDYYRRWVV